MKTTIEAKEPTRNFASKLSHNIQQNIQNPTEENRPAMSRDIRSNTVEYIKWTYSYETSDFLQLGNWI